MIRQIAEIWNLKKPGRLTQTQFDATQEMMNKPIQTKGRETQIWRKLDNEWRLVPIHYSGMPVTGQDQGL
jgi:hypothetical protein